MIGSGAPIGSEPSLGGVGEQGFEQAVGVVARRPRRATSSPSSRAVSLVTGPIETTRAEPRRRTASPTASRKLRTVEEEVKVT